MAEQIISPGVFTRENDLSFLPQGVGAIGAAIVGPTVKGPAFVPTVVRSFSDYERKFGPLSKDTFVPQTVREYLKNAGSVTVCRVLAGGGYTFTNGTNEMVAVVASGSSADNVLLGVIYPSKNTGTPDLKDSVVTKNVGTGNPDLDEKFNLKLSGSNVTETAFSASLNPNNRNYLFKQLGDDPNNSKTSNTAYAGTPGYTHINFKSLQTSIASTVKETATIQFIAMPTASMDSVANSTQRFVLVSADNTSFNLEFSGSGYTATSSPTGAIVKMSLVGGDYAGAGAGVHVPGATGSAVAAAVYAEITRDKINNLASLNVQFSASLSGSGGVQIDFLDAGTATDLTSGFTAATASANITTQGTDVTGYSISSGREGLFLVQNADMTFNGNIGQTEGYSYASTPYITSQFLDVNKTTKQLFKFHTIAHGTLCNTDYKISIANLREPADIDGEEQYSTFSVIIRAYRDTDKNPIILEQFNNCNLDPDSSNYISRVIGDRYPQYNDTLGKVELLGNYSNISDYIRVEVASHVEAKSISPKLSPKGFSSLSNPIRTSSFATNFTFPSASYEGIQQTGTDGTFGTKGYLGFKFKEKEADNVNFLLALPTSAESNVSGDFNVENYSGHMSSSLWSGSLSASVSLTGTDGPTANQLKFTVPFQGGEDGIAPYTVRFTGAEDPATPASTYSTGDNLYGFDLNTTNAAGYKGYKKAIDILENQDEYDINMLAIPGVIHSIHPLVTNAGIDMCEERGDAFFVMDLAQVNASVNTAIDKANALDTNYAATYYPWVKVLDSSINRPILVPPSVIVPGAIAASDRIGAEWFAPAGLNRGILGNVLEAKIRLNQAERDRLYNGKINPIATFPQTGVCIWGQKTLQERPTALDRINVRRLLITLKKFIASSSRYLIFEQNTIETRDRFLGIVNPYLESVQQQQGLYAFRVTMDESNNTADVIDRNQLVGAIYLQPTKTAEFIVLDFNILPTGATFDGGGGY